MQDNVAVKTHVPCPHCGGHDPATIYSDGHGYCFSCNTRWWEDGRKEYDKEPYERKVIRMVEEVEQGKIREIADRCISEDACKKFGVRTLVKDHKIQKHFYPYYNKAGEKVAEKTRICESKQFFWSGAHHEIQLFGAQCQPTTGKFVVVSEGESDCLSLWQALGGRYTVVSLPDGCTSFKALKQNYDYLDKFDSIVLCLDGDKAGRDAVEKAVQFLPQKKLKIMRLPEDLKDPNAFLMAGKTQELVNHFWRAEPYTPKDIVNISTMFDRLLDYRKSHQYISTPWYGLNDIIQGTRPGQVVVLASGSGQGKSLFLKTWMMHVANTTDTHIGTIYLEETPEETVLSLMSQVAGKNLKKNAIYDACSVEELKGYFEAVGAGSKIDLFDPISSTEPEYICNKIRYMAIVRDCKYIILDHLTFIAEAEEDVKRSLDRLMNNLHKLAVELGLVILCACHLRKSAVSAKSAEEGGRITLADMKDSSSIYQLSDVCIALERNSQDPDPDKANTTLIRVLKNRDFGEKGPATAVFYEKETTRLIEVGLEDLEENSMAVLED